MGTGDADIAYIAGLFDGEGNIRVAIKKDDSRRTSRPAYGVYITNTDESVLVWAREKVGLGYVHEKNHNNPRWSRVYVWSIQKLQDIQTFLCMVKPYIRIKKLQLDIMLSLVTSRIKALAMDCHAPIIDVDLMLIHALSKANERGGVKC